jgi:hypothetical protein
LLAIGDAGIGADSGGAGDFVFDGTVAGAESGGVEFAVALCGGAFGDVYGRSQADGGFGEPEVDEGGGWGGGDGDYWLEWVYVVADGLGPMPSKGEAVGDPIWNGGGLHIFYIVWIKK